MAPPANPFRCEKVHAYELPQQTAYIALHTDYSEDFCPTTDIPEDECGEIAIRRLLDGKRGHFGPLEHSHLTLALQADHNTMMQLRTHRVGLSFDLQSQRYTGQRIIDVAKGKTPVTDVFYLRPVGTYSDRAGDPYDYTEAMRESDEIFCLYCANRYANAINTQGMAEEHARFLLPTCYLQNGIVTGNIRSWFHLLDVRLKADAQQEIRWLMELVAQQVRNWIPEIYSWYEDNRRGKALLAP